MGNEKTVGKSGVTGGDDWKQWEEKNKIPFVSNFCVSVSVFGYLTLYHLSFCNLYIGSIELINSTIKLISHTEGEI